MFVTLWLLCLVAANVVLFLALTRNMPTRNQNQAYTTILIVLLFGLGADKQTHAGEPVGYATLAEAATAGLDAADALAPDAEAGGTIRSCLGKFFVIDVVTDHDKHKMKFVIAPLAACPVYALFHTHPKGDRAFSKIDINTTCDMNTIGILRPKGGEAVMFDCRTLSYARVNELTQNTSRPVYGVPVK